MARLTETTVVRDSQGGFAVLAAGDELPGWAEPLVGVHLLTEVDTAATPGTPERSGSRSGRRMIGRTVVSYPDSVDVLVLDVGDIVPDWAADLVGDHLLGPVDDAPARPQRRREPAAPAPAATAAEVGRLTDEQQAAVDGMLAVADALRDHLGTLSGEHLDAAIADGRKQVVDELGAIGVDENTIAGVLRTLGLESGTGDTATEPSSEAPAAVARPGEPPRSGAGSGAAAWKAFAEGLGIHVEDGAKKAEIIAAVDAFTAAGG